MKLLGFASYTRVIIEMDIDDWLKISPPRGVEPIKVDLIYNDSALVNLLFYIFDRFRAEVDILKIKQQPLLVETMTLAISSLRDGERQVLELVFGLAGDTEKTLVETAVILGLTPSRVGQIRNKGMRKLWSRGLKRYLIEDE